jgi:hypothetical protein
MSRAAQRARMAGYEVIDDAALFTRVPPLHDSASVRALQADWDETGRVLDAARARFDAHKDARIYRMECRRIINREDD